MRTRSCVQEHGIFHGARKDAAFLEADDKEEAAAGVGALRERREMKVAGARTVTSDGEAFNALADETERGGEPAAEIPERAELLNFLEQPRASRGVERARLRRAVCQERGRHQNAVLQGDRL